MSSLGDAGALNETGWAKVPVGVITSVSNKGKEVLEIPTFWKKVTDHSSRVTSSIYLLKKAADNSKCHGYQNIYQFLKMLKIDSQTIFTIMRAQKT